MSAYLLLLLILIPCFGAMFVIISKNDRTYSKENIYNVFIWSLLANLTILLYVGTYANVEALKLNIIENYQWLSFPPAKIKLKMDIFSLILLLGVNLSFLIVAFSMEKTTEHAKTLVAGTLLFISLLTGYFIVADMLSFYIFFASLSAPVMILMSLYSHERKKNTLIRFSIYNLIGIFLLFVSVVLIYNDEGKNITLSAIGNLNVKKAYRHFIWLSIFFAFISKLPIWPFHYWISSVNSNIKNPLIAMISNYVILIGLYGFIRFWPNTMPEAISTYSICFEVICIITMLFISLVSLNHKEFRYKIFAYTTVYYLLFLLGTFLPTDKLILNIDYAIFSMLIIISVLYLLIEHMENQKKKLSMQGLNGILCYMPKTSKCLSLFILAGMGLPITPLFWNNFIIISEIFYNNLIMGILVMLSIFIVSISLLEDLYKLKDKSYATTACIVGTDLTNTQFMVYIISLVILFLSFLNPLWFIL